MIKLKDLLNENIGLNENLPPGFDSNDFESMGEFTDTALTEDDEKLLGATTTDLPDDELKQRLSQVIGKPDVYKKTGLPKLDKKGNPKFVSTANTIDKYKYPYIHKSNIIDDAGKPIEPDTLKRMIMVRPDKILKQNTKMMKSGKQVKFYDISLPAFKGLIVDESTGDFKIVNTCPGAGACRVYCYAKKGGYVQWKAASLSSTRVLNFLLNDWQGFKAKTLAEINQYSKNGKKKIILRWHDSGDFLSPKYLQLAYDIAKETPNVTHYAYTKMVGMVSTSSKPNNFIFNYSQGAIAPEEKLIDPKIHKHSVVVPKQVFQDYMVRDTSGKWSFKSADDLKTVKEKMAMKYDIPLDSIITYDELMNIPEDPDRIDKFNTLIWAGHGDDSATRKDVRGTYLFLH